jgi:hypothetical protein
MSIVFITKANANNILYEFDCKEPVLSGDIYQKREFPYFDDKDRKKLLATKKLYENPEDFFKACYRKHTPERDTMMYVYEGKPHAYHSSLNCKKLYSNFIQFPIYKQIRDRGEKEVGVFRKWFDEKKYLIETGKAERFLDYLAVRWGIPSTKSSLADLKRYSNSGAENFENIDLDFACIKIDNLIDTIDTLINSSKKNRVILTRFGKMSYFGARENHLYANNTGYPEDEIKEILIVFDTHKKKLMKLLLQYYRLKLNPKIEIKGNLLDAIGFVPCSACHKKADEQHRKYILNS